MNNLERLQQDFGMLNAIGLQNQAFILSSNSMLLSGQHGNTPVIVNIAGGTVYEFVNGHCLEGVNGVAAIEVNVYSAQTCLKEEQFLV